MYAIKLISALLLCMSFSDVIIAGRDQSRDAIHILNDIRHYTNNIFQRMCTEYCRMVNSPSTCCDEIRENALTQSHLFSRSYHLQSSGTSQSQLMSMLTMITIYQSEMTMMIQYRCGRDCHRLGGRGHRWPLSLELHGLCHLISRIDSFKLIIEQMVLPSGIATPLIGAPRIPNGDSTQRALRDLSMLANASAIWTQMLNMIHQLYIN